MEDRKTFALNNGILTAESFDIAAFYFANPTAGQ